MRRGLLAIMLIILLGSSIGVIAFSNSYALYYACTQEQDTALVIMNSSGLDNRYTIKVYDAYGTLLEAKTYDLDAYQSDYVYLSNLITISGSTWGLALIETREILTIGVETFINDQWCSSDNILDPIPDDPGYTYYWYGLNYSNTTDQTTGIAILNPSNSPAAATVFVYDSFGTPQKQIDVVLDPHETDYYGSVGIVGTAGSMWGVVDIKATVPLVAAAIYFNADGLLLNVDQISYYYYAE
ncbi:hypothetical protein KAV67_01325 [Candidatus Bipolaricaulota bacterium]|nr:hypothetical protein [Candidatus Bipolaricaulota bacterium]